jgi:hypothetical protein
LERNSGRLCESGARLLHPAGVLTLQQLQARGTLFKGIAGTPYVKPVTVAARAAQHPAGSIEPVGGPRQAIQLA